MGIVNKDLEELGVYPDPRFSYESPLNREQETEYGFDAREIYNLDDSLARWLYTHLLMYKRFTICDLEAMTFEVNGVERSMKEWIDLIISACAEYIKVNGICDTNEEARIIRAWQNSLKVLAVIAPALWD